jgi:hypothetical protein
MLMVALLLALGMATEAGAATVEIVIREREQVSEAPFAMVRVNGGPEVDVVTVTRTDCRVRVTTPPAWSPARGAPPTPAASRASRRDQ